MEQKTERKLVWTNAAVVCLVALLCCFLWGSAFPGIKIGYGIFDISGEQTGLQIIFAGTRFFLAGIMAVVIGSFAHKRPLFPKKTSWLPILHLSLLQTTLQYFFFYIGMGKTSGVKASIIEALNVFVALFVACLLFKQEKLTGKKIIGSVLGFLGIVIVNVVGNGFDLSFTLLGEGFILISTISSAFSSAFIKRFSKTTDVVMLSGYQFFFGGVVMATIGLIAGGRLNSVAPYSWVLLCYMGFISAAAYTIWSILLKYNNVSKISAYKFMNPLFGVVLSFIILQEKSQLGIQTVIALILVCAGIYVVNRENK